MSIYPEGWYLRLGNEYRYRIFNNFDPSGLLFSIFADDYRDDMAEYFLYSPHIDQHKEIEDATRAAAEIGILINGVLDVFGVSPRLKLSSHDLLRSKDLTRAGRVIVRPPMPEFRMPYQAIDPKWDKRKISKNNYSGSRSENFCILCLMNDKIRNIALTFGYTGINWISLYATKDHLGFDENTMVARYGIDKTRLRNFTHTANSFASLGPSGRHGQTNHSPPKNPMDLNDATKFIMGMVHKEAEIISGETDFQKKVGEIFDQP